jgi:CDP-diacylglycerol--serine O-phosphatidyltransferase
MFLGFLAIGFLLKGDPIRAGWLILFAGVFDAIDGKLARLLGIPSRFGTEFDSFADTVSFCVAPALLIYRVYVDGLPPLLAGMFSFIPLLFGTIRLARFNLDQDDNPKPFYVGLTTPLNALTLFGYMLFSYQLSGEMGDPRIALVLTVVLGFMMVSPVRFAKLPLLSFKKGRTNSFRLLGFAAMALALILWQGLVLFPLLTIYITWSILNWMIHPHRLEEDYWYKPAHTEDYR